MKGEYDVIVVGAGPAGSMAAKTAAEDGLSVLLIEKRQEIGHPVRCAEGVTEEGLRDLVGIEPRWICARIRNARIHTPSGTTIEFTDDRDVAYVLERKIFDRDLARLASSAGAEVYTKTQASGLVVENGQVCGVRGKCLGDDFQARATVVVAADGVESRVARWAGIDTVLKLKDIGSCAQFHLTNVDVDQSRCEFYFGSAYAPGGYAWVFPKGDGEANVGLGMIYHGSTQRKPIDYLSDFVSRLFPGARVLETMAGAVPISGRIPRLSTGGLVLVGDAGRLTDPVTGEGIINGMISGRIAGKVIAGCIRNGDVSARALLVYDRAITRALGAALDRNYSIKEFLWNASDQKRDFAFRVLKAMGVESFSSSTILREVYSPRSRRAAALLRMLAGY